LVPRVSPDPSVARLAAELLDQIDVLTDDLVDHIRAQIDIYRAETLVDQAELKRSLIANLEHILGQLSGRRLDLDAPTQIGRRRAAQGMPLPEVLRAYRLGFAFLWRRLLDTARRSGQQSVDALLDTATTVWELADDFSLAVTESYRQAISERLLAADRRRSGIVSAVLGGPGAADLSAWEVAKLLDMPYEGIFVVLVAEASDDRGAPLPDLDGSLRRRGIASAWRSQPAHEIGVLSLGRRHAMDELLGLLAEVPTARVGLSPVFDRLDGTARALRLAQVALETLPSESGGVRQLPDVPLADLLVRDLDTTRRFVLRVLGNVLALPDDDRATLLATAEAWIAAHGSAAEAGRVLYCHENTVRHRLHRLEGHLGASLDDPRNLADLTTALEAIRTFPQLGDRVS
jgi:PucR C-terminal helix-turn-helix domain/GGDEF-like domain